MSENAINFKEKFADSDLHKELKSKINRSNLVIKVYCKMINFGP